MSSFLPIQKTLTGVLALLIAVATVPVASGQTNLAAQLVPRAVTNDDIANYKLPASAENSGGLTTVGIGQPFYLEADVDITVPAKQIAGVTWTLTGQPT